MLCPRCKIEGAIADSKYVTVNDDTADKETKLYIEQRIACRNRNCPDCGKIFHTARNEIQLSKG